MHSAFARAVFGLVLVLELHSAGSNSQELHAPTLPASLSSLPGGVQEFACSVACEYRFLDDSNGVLFFLGSQGKLIEITCTRPVLHLCICAVGYFRRSVAVRQPGAPRDGLSR